MRSILDDKMKSLQSNLQPFLNDVDKQEYRTSKELFRPCLMEQHYYTGAPTVNKWLTLSRSLIQFKLTLRLKSIDETNSTNGVPYNCQPKSERSRMLESHL